jgi:hypothetical protein
MNRPHITLAIRLQILTIHGMGSQGDTGLNCVGSSEIESAGVSKRRPLATKHLCLFGMTTGPCAMSLPVHLSHPRPVSGLKGGQGGASGEFIEGAGKLHG